MHQTIERVRDWQKGVKKNDNGRTTAKTNISTHTHTHTE